MNEPRVSRLEAGVLLSNAYRVEEWLGGGGYGDVYRAHSLRLDRPVAVKVMKPRAGKGIRERFLREAQLTKRLEHPNTVRLLDYGGLEEEMPFLVWELLRGQTLAERLEQRGPMAPLAVARLARQVLSSLEEAHSLGIIHRDIKPSNLMLCDFEGEKDFVKVLDFGVAKDVITGLTDLTDEGEVVGTPRYMSPEQVLGKGIVPGTDLYALGLVMAEALTGSPMVEASSKTQAVALQAMETDLDVDPQVLSGPLGGSIRRATRKRLGARFGSADAMRDMILEEIRTVRFPQAAGEKEDQPEKQHHQPETLEPMLDAGAKSSVSSAHAIGSKTTSPRSWVLMTLGFATIVVAGAGMLWLNQPSMKTEAALGLPSVIHDDPVPALPIALPFEEERDWHPPSTPLPDNVNPRAFDPLAFFPQAQARAQQEFADAMLTSLQVKGVWQSSYVDLFAVPDGAAIYWFRSAEASKPPSSFPTNIDFENRCLVVVSVDDRGLSVLLPLMTCDMPMISPPRCSLEQIVTAFASNTGASTRNSGLHVDYRWRLGSASWLVEAGSYGSEVLPDDCP
jgi:serine/threonine protein kinase